MPFILLAIVAVAAIVVSGMSAIHGTTIVTTGAAAITPASSGLPLSAWLLVIAVGCLCCWWLLRKRTP